MNDFILRHWCEGISSFFLGSLGSGKGLYFSEILWNSGWWNMLKNSPRILDVHDFFWAVVKCSLVGPFINTVSKLEFGRNFLQHLRIITKRRIFFCLNRYRFFFRKLYTFTFLFLYTRWCGFKDFLTLFNPETWKTLSNLDDISHFLDASTTT